MDLPDWMIHAVLIFAVVLILSLIVFPRIDVIREGPIGQLAEKVGTRAERAEFDKMKESYNKLDMEKFLNDLKSKTDPALDDLIKEVGDYMAEKDAEDFMKRISAEADCGKKEQIAVEFQTKQPNNPEVGNAFLKVSECLLSEFYLKTGNMLEMANARNNYRNKLSPLLNKAKEYESSKAEAIPLDKSINCNPDKIEDCNEGGFCYIGKTWAGSLTCKDCNQIENCGSYKTTLDCEKNVCDIYLIENKKCVWNWDKNECYTYSSNIGG